MTSFDRTVLQTRVNLDMVELTSLQLPLRDLKRELLVEKLNDRLGGKCHEDVYIRKGKQYFEIQQFSLPETDGADMSVTVQFLCDTFAPKNGSVFEMKVDCVFSVEFAALPMLECSWPDPETGEVAMRAYVLSTGPETMSVGRIVNITLGEVIAEVGHTHLKCKGEVTPN